MYLFRGCYYKTKSLRKKIKNTQGSRLRYSKKFISDSCLWSSWVQSLNHELKKKKNRGNYGRKLTGESSLDILTHRNLSCNWFTFISVKVRLHLSKANANKKRRRFQMFSRDVQFDVYSGASRISHPDLAGVPPPPILILARVPPWEGTWDQWKYYEMEMARVPPWKGMGPVEVLWDGDRWGPSRKGIGPVEVLWDGDGWGAPMLTDICENITFPYPFGYGRQWKHCGGGEVRPCKSYVLAPHNFEWTNTQVNLQVRFKKDKDLAVKESSY